MLALLPVLLSLAGPAGPWAATGSLSDTLRLDIGSREVDGRLYEPHAARVRIRVGDEQVAEYTNLLTLGDSAGRPVMRWVTRGTRRLPDGNALQWEILQTYDRITLAPYGHVYKASNGTESRLTIQGQRVRGERRTPSDTTWQPVEFTVPRPGFIASASDLVPLAAGLAPGRVMVAPMWGPNMPDSELRVFTVLGQTPVDVEGKTWNAWKIEEHRLADRKLLATWWMVDESPYMVYGEVPLPDGRVQKMTEVAIPMP